MKKLPGCPLLSKGGKWKNFVVPIFSGIVPTNTVYASIIISQKEHKHLSQWKCKFPYDRKAYFALLFLQKAYFKTITGHHLPAYNSSCSVPTLKTSLFMIWSVDLNLSAHISAINGSSPSENVGLEVLLYLLPRICNGWQIDILMLWRASNALLLS